MDYELLIQTVKAIENQLIDKATGGNPYNYSYNRNILISEFHNSTDEKFKNNFPLIVSDYDTLNAFWGFIKYKFNSYAERKKYIYESFIPIKQYLESKIYTKTSKILVPNIVLSNQYIQDAIDKANQRIKTNDFDGAITSARTLVEEIQVEIYKKLNSGQEPNHKGDLNKLYNAIASSLKLSISKDLDERLKSILSGLYSINNGIANLRNISGDAHAKKFKPLSHHAQLAVNCAFTFSQFLCDTFLYQLIK